MSAHERPPTRAILEGIDVLSDNFDMASMARGAPGVPRRFRWRGAEYEVVEILGESRETEGTPESATERYVRRHTFWVRTACGEVMLLSAGRGLRPGWILRALQIRPEDEAEAPGPDPDDDDSR